ncbi:MAG: DUF1573 domain-containing protein [Alistipes sp.]|nr:DUF1573 domain-containing protein [Alistipes sp.]
MLRLFVCLVLALCFRTVDAVAQQVGPKMTFDCATHDFGDVERKGGDLLKEFRFVNDGDAPLVIKKITKSCSCLTIHYPRKPIMPGQSGVIEVSYEPHKVEAGVFNRVIQIYTNSSSKVRLLAIQGNSVEKLKRKK